MYVKFTIDTKRTIGEYVVWEGSLDVLPCKDDFVQVRARAGDLERYESQRDNLCRDVDSPYWWLNVNSLAWKLGDPDGPYVEVACRES